jgi:hypothetical protein
MGNRSLKLEAKFGLVLAVGEDYCKFADQFGFSRMRGRLVGAVMLVAVNSYVAAQAETVERTAQGETGKDIQIGVYVNVQPDCTSGPLPTMRLLEPPAHGKVTVKKGNVSATNYKQCLALSVPAYVAFYRSERNFLGSDSVLLEVRYPGGKQELHNIVITVRAGQSI